MASDNEHAQAEDLYQLFGAYLNQDFMDEYDGPWDAVRDFCHGYPTDSVARAAEQVRALLESGDDEAQLETATDELGLEYYPPADGFTYRGWLTELGNFLRQQSSTLRE